MILKIQRYEEGQSFYLIDNIRKICVSEDVHEELRKTRLHQYDVVVFDYFNQNKNSCSCDGIKTKCSNCKFYREIILRTNNDDEFSIAFDTIAYILNDNGKTIEKIVANYND